MPTVLVYVLLEKKIIINCKCFIDKNFYKEIIYEYFKYYILPKINYKLFLLLKILMG